MTCSVQVSLPVLQEPVRGCGGCTLCCKLVEAQVLSKKAGELCRHCDNGVGCTIHETRPVDCQEFSCVWLESTVLGEDLRPDRCGVVLEAFHPQKTVVAMVNEGQEGVWKRGNPRLLISQMLMDGYVVWVLEGSARHLLLPQGETEESALKKAEEAWRGAWRLRVTPQT